MEAEEMKEKKHEEEMEKKVVMDDDEEEEKVNVLLSWFLFKSIEHMFYCTSLRSWSRRRS